MDKYRYDFYLRVYNDISKIKDIKTDFLTKEQKFEIDNFYRKHYGKKISYMWHNLMVSYTKKFDVTYIPPGIFIKINKILNSHNSSSFIFYDKNLFYGFAKKANIKTPERFFYSINNLFF
ncbi:MAG: hypothetical protein IKO48_02200 [Elusimicrobia bacterium]|nr:hypothetical protein [Elusimicrobiota bacterium]